MRCRFGCSRPHHARGLCHSCYERLRSRGEIVPLERPSFADRFWSFVAIGAEDACWPWQGYCNNRSGYGQVTIAPNDVVRWGRRIMTTHVVACTLAHGPRPEGAYTLHSCDNRPCCNPAHLRWGTPSENVRDAIARGRHHGNQRVDA